MRGIVGHIKGNNYIKEMLSKIKHFGSFVDCYEDDYISLGTCSNEKQKIFIKDEYVILFDGSISNDSSFCDEEYIINLYKKQKETIFKKLIGSFAICLYNIKNHQIILARDKFGIRPLYYTKNNFTFASEIKAILENPLYEKDFNSNALKDYLLYLTNPSNKTLFKGIYKVEAGSYVIYDNCEIKTIKYHNFKFQNLIYDKEELKDKIKNNIDNNFHSDKKICSFLSSGIDSSLITSVCKPKDTFTVGYEETSYNESSYAKKLCDLLKIRNNEIIVKKEEFLLNHLLVEKYTDEPCLDPAVVALYFGASRASNKYKYIYSGEGSDELFAGYNSYLESYKYKSLENFPKLIKRIILSMCNIIPEVKGVNFLIRRCSKTSEYYTGVSRIFNNHTLDKLLNNKTKNNILKYNKVINLKDDKLEQMQIIDINYWLQEEINATSKMCNINNMEVLMPFLNEELYNIAMSIPSSYKINDNTTKAILREVAKDYIPNDAYQNKKLGFPVPIRDWLKTTLYYNQIKESFNSDHAKELFNIKILNKMLDNHYYDKKDYSKQIWCIYSFLVWYNLYF